MSRLVQDWASDSESASDVDAGEEDLVVTVLDITNFRIDLAKMHTFVV